jgi:YD repeat-containing protein
VPSAVAAERETARTTRAFPIPGTRDVLTYERDASGRLLRLSAGGRAYLEEQDGERVFDGGMARVSEARIPSGMLRRVRASGESWNATWVEEYHWDDVGRPVRIDGVAVERDARHRVSACRSPQGDWHYAYSGDHLARIEGPFGARRLRHDAAGRPVHVTEGQRSYGIGYDGDGRRHRVPAPPGSWHRDPLGRLWTVTGPDGAAHATYLWDGFACLGRIDGPPGAPLAAVFSLDPSLTPVRVITRRGVTRIPRDAFGEALLGHHGVPGLFGGAMHGGFVHLSARALDPRVGAFAAPDPWHGLADDPRRAGGYRGPLTVERAAPGPYGVCRYDAVGRADPTGEISAGLLVLDFTWALQNNIASFFGLDWTLGPILSLFSGTIGRFFDFEGVTSSDRLGAWGIRRDGFWTMIQEPRAWTFGHLMFETEKELQSLEDAHVFQPEAAFLPTLYGTLLSVRPDGHDSFVLNTGWSMDGAVRPAAAGWTRAGGTAEAVIPGSLVPRFPGGGLHFDAVRTGLRGPLGGVLTELDPSATLALGTIINRTIITISRTGLGVEAGHLLLLTNDRQGGAILVVQTVEEIMGATRITAEPAYASLVDEGRVRARSLDPAPTGTQTLNLATDVNGNRIPTHLDLAGGPGTYAIGDPLRISQNAMELAGVVVTRFETQVQVDATLAGGASSVTPPLEVFVAVPDTGVTPVNATVAADPAGGAAPVLQFGAGQAQGVNAAGLLIHSVSGATLAVVITEDAGSDRRRVDRDVTAGGFAALGDTVSWQQLRQDVALGSQDAGPDGADTVTYAPDSLTSTPPAGGLVWVEGDSGRAVRRVLAVRYMALIVNAALPGDPAQVYSVERFAVRTTGDGAIDQDGVNLTREQEVTLNPPTAIAGAALQVQRYDGANAATIPSTTVLTGLTITAATPDVARGSLNAGAGNTTPTPGQVVRLNPGPAAVLAAVRSVRLTVTFSRPLRLTTTQDLEAVPLGMYRPTYNAERVAARRIRVLGTMGAVPVAAPVVRPGERVRIAWQGPPGADNYTVASVAADLIDLAATPGMNLAAGASDFTLQRFVPSEFPYEAVRQGDFAVTVLSTDELRRLPGDPDTSVASVAATVAADPAGGAPPLLQFPTGQAPAAGTEGLLTLATGGARRVVVVTEDAGSDRRRVDRDLTLGGFAAVGDTVTWQQIRPENRRVHLPRFRPGELVEVTWDGAQPPGAPGIRHYRVETVEGTTLTFAQDADPLAAVTPSLLVTRLSPVDPQTGGSRLGIRGSPVGASPGPDGTSVADRIQFDAWQPAAFAPDLLIAIVDGDHCHAAAVSRAAQKEVEVEFAAPPGMTGTVDIAAPTLQDGGYSTSFSQPDDGRIILQEPPVLRQPGGSLVAIVPFVEAGGQVGGTLHPGTVLVPQDPEYPEITRRQSLIDHELTHTIQALRYGPILLNFFPLWVIELIVELATDVELPAFSAYVSAEVMAEEEGGAVRLLRIPDAQGIPFGEGNHVEISRGALPERFRLGSRREDGRFVLIPGPPWADIPPGTRVFVRRENDSGWTWFLQIAPFFTLGGITKTVAGFTYGGLFLGLAKAIYGLYRLIKGTGDTHPATVEENGTRLRLGSEAGRSALRGARQIVIRSGSHTAVRSVEGITNGAVSLTQATEFRGAVEVALFAVHTPGDLWDWNDYFPASIPDPTRPARIRIGRAGDESLGLDPFDRVLISDGAREHRTYVTAVEAETPADPESPPFTRIEVADPPFILDVPEPRQTFDAVVEPDGTGVRLPTIGEEAQAAQDVFRDAVRIWIRMSLFTDESTVRIITGITGNVVHLDQPIEYRGHVAVAPVSNEFRIAKIGSRDPMGDATNAALHFTSADWMRWIFDPWGNIPFRAQASPGSFWDVLARIGRYAFSTQGWTFLPLPPLPQPFGWFWWDRAFRGESDYLSQMEQEASEESGDLYTQLARLNGDRRWLGDIARYWYFLNDREGSVIAGARQDAPAVHLRGFPRVSPFAVDTAPATRPEPNQGIETDPARAAVAGLAMPDIFYTKGPDNPSQAPPNNPVGFTPSPLGWIPVSQVLERTCGNYVAFSRPGRHRVTVGNAGDDDSRKSREAQQETRFASDQPKQTIWFDVDVTDFPVWLGGQRLREGATITLLQTQRARLIGPPLLSPPCTVSLVRPSTGTLLRADSNDTAIVAQTTNGMEPAEITRVYRVDPAAGGYPGGLGPHGAHLAVDVHVPVLTLRIRVTDTPPVLGALPANLDSDPYALPAAALTAGGEVFVLVPASVISRTLDPATYTNPRPAVVTDPNPQIAAEDTASSVTGDLREFIGDGRIYRITLDAADPPEDEGIESVLRLTIGLPADNVEVRARIRLQPHFRLDPAPGLEVPRGGALTLTCTEGVQAASTVAVIPSGGIAASVAGSVVTLTVAADAAPGTRQIVVTNAANPARRARRTILVT